MALNLTVSISCGIADCTGARRHILLHVNLRYSGPIDNKGSSSSEAEECLHLMIISNKMLRTSASLSILLLGVRKNGKEVRMCARLDFGHIWRRVFVKEAFWKVVSCKANLW